jgi:hypothetical protein
MLDWTFLSLDMGQTVSDEEAGECVDPEGNGVNPGEGDGGGPARLLRSKMSS